jgi:hypothetical protein
MSPSRKKRTSIARPGFQREGWRARVHPAFVAYWTGQRNNMLLPDPTAKDWDEKVSKWSKEFEKASRAFEDVKEKIKEPASAKIQSAIFKRLDTESPPVAPSNMSGSISAANPESSGVFRKLVFLKYGLTFRELIWRVDIERDEQSYRKLMAVHRDYWKYKSQRGDFRDLKLKFHWDHFDIITQGFDFGFEHLTHYELADCLDAICPCCQKHSPEYLKKLRKILKDLCGSFLKGQ